MKLENELKINDRESFDNHVEIVTNCLDKSLLTPKFVISNRRNQ